MSSIEKNLPLLRCPQTHAPLVFEGDSLVSTDPATRLRYMVRDDIPVMIVDEAVMLSEDEWHSIMRKHGQSTATATPNHPR
jgi:uncharacterized protein YbaR (Trm112 family)